MIEDKIVFVLLIVLIVVVIGLMLKKLFVFLTIKTLQKKGYGKEFIDKHLEKYYLK